MFIDKSLVNTMTTSQVAYEVEKLAGEIFNCDFKGTLCLFNYRYIQSHYFIDSLTLILYAKNINGIKTEDFITKYSKFERVNMDQISCYKEIFFKFLEIFENEDKSIHYHIIVEDKDNQKYYKDNLLNITLVNELVTKYKNYDDFYIGGKYHNKADIKSFKIRTTKGFPQSIVTKINECQIGKFLIKEDILSDDAYSKDVTDELIK